MNQEIQVGLGLNTTQFQEGLKGATREVSAFSSKANAPFGALRGAVSAVTGAFGAMGASVGAVALVASIKSVSEYAEKIRNLSEALNINTTDLQKWLNAVAYSGVSSAVAEKALTKFTMNLSEAESGTGKAAATFANLGITIRDASGQMRPTMDVLNDLQDVFATMPDKSERSRAAVELFGKKGLSMVAALSLGREEMERLGGIQSIISPEALETLDKMGDDIKETVDGFKNLGVSALAAMAPVVDFFKNASAGARGFVPTMKDALAAFIMMGEGEKTFALRDTEKAEGKSFWAVRTLVSIQDRMSGVSDVLNPHGTGMRTDSQRKVADDNRLKTIRAMVQASKEQLEFEKAALKERLSTATADEKVQVLLEKHAELEKHANTLAQQKDKTEEAGRKHLAAETALKESGIELDKAIATQQEEAARKRGEAYAKEADALNRINALKEISKDLEKTITEIKERGTKTTVKELAQAPLLRSDTAEERKNKLDARRIDEIEQRQEIARKGGRFEEALKLQKQAAELRKQLSPKAFQQQEINPFADLEKRKEESEIGLGEERARRAAELKLKADAEVEKLKAEREKNRKNLGEGWDVSDEEKKRRFDIIGAAEQRRQALEEAANARSEAARDAGLAELDKLPDSALEKMAAEAADKQASVIAAMVPDIPEPMAVEAEADKKARWDRVMAAQELPARTAHFYTDKPDTFVDQSVPELPAPVVNVPPAPAPVVNVPPLPELPAPVVNVPPLPELPTPVVNVPPLPELPAPEVPEVTFRPPDIQFDPGDITTYLDTIGSFDSAGIIDEMSGLRADIKAGIRVRLTNTA